MRQATDIRVRHGIITTSFLVICTIALAGLSPGCDSPMIVVLSGDPEPSRPTGAFRLEVGQAAHAADIALAGDVDYYVVNLVAGQVYAVATSGSSDTVLMLLDSDGVTTLDYSDDVGADLNARIAWRVPENGDYYLAVGLALPLSTGEYSIQVTEIADDYPNDCASATALTVGGSLVGRVDYAGDVDYSRLPVEGGIGYRVTVTATSALVVSIFETDGDEPLAVTEAGPEAAGIALISAQRTGELCLAVADAADGTGDFVVTYEVLPADDFGDSPLDAALLPEDGSSVEGAIDYAGDVDIFFLPAVAGYDYHVATSGDSDTYLELLDTDGVTLLAFNDDSADGGVNASLDFTAPQDGNYYLAVTLFDTEATGAYVLSVTTSAVPGAEESAVALSTDGTPLEGEIAEPAEIDVYVFTAEEGQTLVLETGGTSDTYLEVYAADDGPLTVDDEWGAESNARVEWVVPAAGDYYLLVTLYDPEDTGAYTVSITTVDPADLDRCATAPAISVGGPEQVGALVPPDDADYYVLTATAGTTYLLETSGDGDVYVSVLDTDGFTLLAADDDSGPDWNASLLWTADATGDYCVEVIPVQQDPLEYGLSVSVADLVDQGDTVDDADEFVVDGPVVWAAIDAAGDVDVFEFAVEAGQSYILETVGTTDTVLSLLAADGALLTSDDDGSSTGSNSRIAWTAEDSGTLFAAVMHFSELATEGYYGLTITTAP